MIRRVAKEALRLSVCLDQRHMLTVSPGKPKVVQCHVVDWEDRNRCTVFRRHVAQCCTIGNCQMLKTGSVKFNKLPHNPMLAKSLGNGEHEVCRGDAFI